MIWSVGGVSSFNFSEEVADSFRINFEVFVKTIVEECIAVVKTVDASPTRRIGVVTCVIIPLKRTFHRRLCHGST